MLNDKPDADTGQYENAAYLIINRPLYSTWARFTGGLTLSANRSVNINQPCRTQFTEIILTIWLMYGQDTILQTSIRRTGYNSRNQILVLNSGVIQYGFYKEADPG